MANNNVINIIVTVIRPSCIAEPDVSERLRKAMRAARREDWLTADEDIQLKSAVVAAMLETTDPDEKLLIEDSWRSLAALGALIGGVPVDMERASSVFSADRKPIPIFALWQETAA